MKKVFLLLGLGAITIISGTYIWYHVQEASVEKIFTQWYYDNIEKGIESVSGGGSDLAETKIIRKELPTLLQQLNINSMLDAPCGDLNWIKKMDLSFLTLYIGADIVRPLINHNQINYGTKNIFFMHLDIIHDAIPYADLILCRDCFVHLKYTDIATALKNFKKSGAKYLLTTQFFNEINKDLTHSGYWRPINLQKPPFNLPKPLTIINEQCPHKNFQDKSLALWALEDITLT